MNKKLSNNEIKKALENAKYRVDGIVTRGFYLDPELFNQIVDLFNHLEAENERLLQKTQRPPDVDPMDFCGVLCDFAEGLIKKAKTEAYKECFEKIKSYYKETRFAYEADKLIEEIEDILREKLNYDGN